MNEPIRKAVTSQQRSQDRGLYVLHVAVLHASHIPSHLKNS